MNRILTDNGGRRLGIERRVFLYDQYIPEKRSGEDRRSGKDRRRNSRVSQYQMNSKDYSPWK